MSPYRRDEREIDTTATRGCSRAFLMAVLTAASIGLWLGIVWVVAGLLRMHPLW